MNQLDTRFKHSDLEYLQQSNFFSKIDIFLGTESKYHGNTFWQKVIWMYSPPLAAAARGKQQLSRYPRDFS